MEGGERTFAAARANVLNESGAGDEVVLPSVTKLLLEEFGLLG